jgi:PAS domain S-box-containing protein
MTRCSQTIQAIQEILYSGLLLDECILISRLFVSGKRSKEKKAMSVAELPSSIAQQHVHTVQFYGEDGVLLHELKGYIGSALAAGSSAIVIATEGHIFGLARTLEAHGIDIRKAEAENRYFALNAIEVMSRFIVDGRPDPVRFEEVVGSLIARAAQGARDENRCVVAFGEMVALLWAEGRTQAALELEKMWNALAKRHSFSLHCAYPMQGFRREELADSLLRISAEHTGVVENDSGTKDGHCRDSKPRGEVSSLTKVEWLGRDEPFKLFVQNVEDYAIFMLDVEGRIVTWNPGARRIKGYKASEIVGQHFSRFYPEEDVRTGKPQTLLNRAIKAGHVEDEGWRVRKDGSKFWANVTITAVKDDAGKLIGFGKVTRDLTERKRAELALHRSEERARLFVEAVQDYAIFMLDPEGCISTWNTGAERIKGYKASDIIGQHFSRFYSEEDVRAGKPDWELKVALKEGRLEDEGWRLRKDGSRFWANVIITPVRDHQGTLIGFSKVTRDFTERMIAQRSLEDSKRRLQESERSLRDLSLHLLRTQDEERRRIGREIHDSLGQYLSVLKMKLDSISDGSPQEIGECSSLVEECVKEVRTISYLLYPPMLEEMGLKSAIPWYLEGFSKRSGIKANFSAELGRLSRDAELVLFRVLQESLTNVQRHSGSKTVDIGILQSKDKVTLHVRDQGKGMPSAVIEQGSQDWMGSLGVGLRGMSERLRQIGGDLEISSSETGTEVRATVPLTKLQSTTTSST